MDSSSADNKNYEQISECLLGFRAGTMRLGDLVEKLPELLKQLGDVDPTWKTEFVSQWWTLEQVHGQAIDKGESSRMPIESRRTVDEAVARLEELVNTAASN